MDIGMNVQALSSTEQRAPAPYGATVIAAGLTRFRLWGPGLRNATLEFQSGHEEVRLASLGDGWFEADVPVPAGTRYRYKMDNGAAVTTAPDPASRAQDGDVHGWSVVVDHASYVWRCTEWRGRPWEETVVHEVHAGLYGGFKGVERLLREWAELGITAIELMPIADFPGTRNWGYDGTLLYAPDETYGSPDDLRSLVDTAHTMGLMIFLDVVYNHFGPDGNYLGSADPLTFREDIPTAWGASIDFRRPEVRDFFTGSAMQWIEAYRFDGLRFDAVHAINDPTWLDEVALTLRAKVGDSRLIHLVVENDANEASHLGLEPHRYDAQWNDDFHHVMHVLLTDETRGYYGDYAEKPAALLARSLGEGYIYQGEPSAHRGGEPRGTPSGHLPPTSFINFLQNHDQIGNRPFGDRLRTLTSVEALKAGAALVLLSPQIPMLFMGEEVGATAPFLYFTDHHDELADLVREGRRNEFSQYEEFADPAQRERIPDPNAESTFNDSLPKGGADANEWKSFYKELLALRRKHIVPRLKGASTLESRAVADKVVQASWKMGDGTVLEVQFNLGDRAIAGLAVPKDALLQYASAPGDDRNVPRTTVVLRPA